MAHGPHSDQLILAINHSESTISRELIGARKDIADSRSLLSAEMSRMSQTEDDHFSRILEQVKLQSESKIIKAFYVALPVLLGFLVWALQLKTNQKIDSTSKELATRLALTEEYYKKQLSIYEDADGKMASIVEELRDMRVDPSRRAVAADDVRNLSELVKTKKIFFSAEVHDALEDVAFTAAGLTDPHPTSTAQILAEKVAGAENLMMAELEGKMWHMDQQR